jgi:hypothetical protein
MMVITMIIANILRLQQPRVYNALIDVFELADIEVEEREPITYVDDREFPEEDRKFAATKEMMEKPRGFKL